MIDLEREIPPQDREAAVQSLARALMRYLPGHRLEVRARRKKRERSDLQNRALWGCAYKALAEQTGNDPEDLHAYFCGRRWGWKQIKVIDQVRRVPRRTTTRDEDGNRDVLGTLDMAEFYEFVQRVAAQVGYDVPDPDPEWFRAEKVA